MNPIQNYYMMSNTKRIAYQHDLWVKWNWLSKLTNWFLRKMGAMEMTQTYDRIELSTDKILLKVRRALYHQKSHNENIELIVLGFNEWHEILRDADMQMINRSFEIPNAQTLFGYRVILSPFISGFVIVPKP